ncbi:MAG: Holliday junction resolvase RuvX [candidate division NC10 bacterium]|nr:Holliday junction resolvase RuvX [candidate division NC10 bacterium]
MRILGIDWGKVRLGLAVSDESALIAQGLTSLPRSGNDTDMQAIARYAAEWQVYEIVVGLPRNMDGSLGEAARSVQQFAERLESALQLPVRLWDERLTTQAAERTLIEAGVRRRARRAAIDKMAAALILQGFLDRKRAGTAPTPRAT